jgi:hypothetical protein
MALELPKFGSKNKTEKKTAPKNDTMLKVMDFFDKNPIMKIIIPVVLFLILAGVLLVLIFGDGVLTNDHTTGTTDIQSNSNQVEILGNNLIKDKEIVELIESDPLSEDVLASAKYKAYSSGSSGLKVAMIEIGSMGDTFSLSKGETIGSWELVEITKEYVVFKAGEITKKLDLTNK